jgi:hypothetical protein
MDHSVTAFHGFTAAWDTSSGKMQAYDVGFCKDGLHLLYEGSSMQ